MRQGAELVPERSRQVGSGQDVIEAVEHDQHARGCSREFVEDEADQVMKAVVLKVEVLRHSGPMRSQLGPEVGRETPPEIAVGRDAGVPKVDVYGRQIVPGTLSVGVRDVPKQDGLPVVRRADDRDMVGRRLRQVSVDAPEERPASEQAWNRGAKNVKGIRRHGSIASCRARLTMSSKSTLCRNHLAINGTARR